MSSRFESICWGDIWDLGTGVEGVWCRSSLEVVVICILFLIKLYQWIMWNWTRTKSISICQTTILAINPNRIGKIKHATFVEPFSKLIATSASQSFHPVLDEQIVVTMASLQNSRMRVGKVHYDSIDLHSVTLPPNAKDLSPKRVEGKFTLKRVTFKQRTTNLKGLFGVWGITKDLPSYTNNTLNPYFWMIGQNQLMFDPQTAAWPPWMSFLVTGINIIVCTGTISWFLHGSYNRHDHMNLCGKTNHVEVRIQTSNRIIWFKPYFP